MDSQNKLPLKGVRVWISGSIPDDSKRGDSDCIKNFIRIFAEKVIRGGGIIIHGCHPSITPTLIDVSEKLIVKSYSKRENLNLFYSKFFDSTNLSINEYRAQAMVFDLPMLESTSRAENLDQLRNWMGSRADAIVVIGGKTPQSGSSISGIEYEIEHSIKYGLPCFILGGFGGAASQITQNNLSEIRNGLDPKNIDQLYDENDPKEAAKTVFNALSNLPIAQGVTKQPSFRILALDGGGLKGIFSAVAIAKWEERTGNKACEHFDLVAGTSTGGILALGLSLGLSGADMVKFYHDRGPKIFRPASFNVLRPIQFITKIGQLIKNIFVAKHSQKNLLKQLQEAYGKNATTIANSKCRLLITSFHSASGRSKIFRTPHIPPDFDEEHRFDPAHIALATSAAPTFFKQASLKSQFSESKFIDGGVWANSPTIAAIVEATSRLNIPLNKIDLLSVGTTEEPFHLNHGMWSGFLCWLKGCRIIEVFMNAQQESSITLAKTMLGNERFLRVNATVEKGRFSLDDPNCLDEIASLAEEISCEEETLKQIKSRFLNGIQAEKWNYDRKRKTIKDI